MATLDDEDKKWMKDNFLTGSKETFNAFKALIESVLDERKVVTQDDISHLPHKEEFFESQDEQMTELQAIREEQSIQSSQISRNTDRIEKLEEIHPEYQHS